MRTIRLKEQEATACRLSKAELAFLQSVERTTGGPIVSVTMLGGDQDVYCLRAGSIVGTLVCPTMQVLIQPKVDPENVFFLLGFRGGLAHWGEESFAYEREPDFLRAMAWAFDAEVRRALRYGIARGYVDREEGLATIRGRIDIDRQLHSLQERPLPIHCRYQEYSEDVALNQVIKGAQRRLLGVPGLGPALVRDLHNCGLAFSEVSDVEYSRSSVPRIAFTRLNRQWESAARLAMMILQLEALKDEVGTTIGSCFTVDMNVLFEKFIEEIVREEASKVGLTVRPQARVALTDEVAMRPDFLLTSGRAPVAVADAKYIELEPAGLPNANLYQLLAYCVALGLPRGLLIYANSRPPEVQRVVRGGTELEVVGIDMSLPAERLLQQARNAAQRLMMHAQLQHSPP